MKTKYCSPIGEGVKDLPMCEGLSRVRPEGEFGPEDGLALQPRALPDEQVVVVPLGEYNHLLNKF